MGGLPGPIRVRHPSTEKTSVEGTDTGWMTVLEKKGLHQVAGILENYGIDSETDVSLIDQDDFHNLASQGLKSM